MENFNLNFLEGEFTTVTKKIEKLPANFDGLVKEIIKRINSDYKENVIKEVLFSFIIIVCR